MLAMQLGAFISDEMVAALTAVGGVMLIGLGFSILEIKKIPIANMLPALLVVILLVWLYRHSGIAL